MDISTLTKDELLDLCDKVGVHPGGTKEELIAKLSMCPRLEAMQDYPDK